ncbi:DUF4352 domain-containing protein [Streptomyces sp. H34-S4]|uniref:DUF4352 domain-containing protein n=1 Tax=Streptomyces sp. H34-S4 TaxID=2996463 RepID=UPI0022722380|nr:DUF4352 domain-containing protein [Streptomyces sp. H34-S4]MCY0937774.1 DUF4352 domain-containing protein [Streptomyces sp. H34-S4]
MNQWAQTPPKTPMNVYEKITIGVCGTSVLAMTAGIMFTLGYLGPKDDALIPTAETAVEEAPWGVTLTATKTAFKPTVLHEKGREYTAVKITVVSTVKATVGVSPLYFSATDANGVNHDVAVRTPADGLITTTLKKGQKVNGTIAFEGNFAPVTVHMKRHLFSDSTISVIVG